MHRVRFKAFTLIELLVVLAVLAVLMAILLPSLSAARDAARRSACMANLHSIGQAMNTYASQEGQYPTNLPPTKASSVGTWKNPPPSAVTQFGKDPVTCIFTQSQKFGDPMTNLWILVLQGAATTKQFICMSDPRNPVPACMNYDPPAPDTPGIYTNFGKLDGSNYKNGATFSYAFAYPWSSPTSAVPPWWKGNVDAAQPIGADIGPSMTPPLDDPTAAPGTAASNSKNHGGRGQNVLFADAHVDFAKGNNVGKAGDNIYTGDANNIWVVTGGAKCNQIVNLNADPKDVILVPANP